MSTDEAEPIEAYLDQLLANARGNPHDVRRLLAETESHLYDDAEAEQLSGADRHTAERRVVERLGPAQRLACRDVRPAGLVRELAWRATLLTGIGCAAIGVSGLLTLVMNAAFGSMFVWADAPGVRDSATACAHYLSAQPQVHTCAAAALAESADDGQLQRFAVGAFGLLLLLGLGVLRSRTAAVRRPDHAAAAPDRSIAALVTAAVATTAFGGAAVFLLGHTVDRVITASGDGMGQWLSAAVVSVVISVYFVVVLLRGLASSPSLTPSVGRAARL